MALSRTMRRKIKAAKDAAKAERLVKANAIWEANERNAIIAYNLNTKRPTKFEDGRGLYRSTMASLTSQSHRGIVSSNIARVNLYGIDDNGRMR